VAVKRWSSTAEDGEDLTEYGGGCLTPRWLGGPHGGQDDSGIDEQDKHSHGATEDQQYMERKDHGKGGSDPGGRDVHKHDDAGPRCDRVLTPRT
jgi:hypothetical protein